MRDLDIRQALHQELREQHIGEPDTLIVDELGLCQGISRVDVAVINGAITGYEIKSEHDTLARLPTQSEVYSRTLDRVIVVASSQHIEAITKLVPDWYGLQVSVAADEGIFIETVREAEDNPGVDPFSVVQLLWREEALLALKDIGLDKGMLSKPRRALWSVLAKNLPAEDLKAVVRRHLKARANWRSAE